MEEFQAAGTALVHGVVITVVYDLIRIFRRVISHGNFWIGVEDFLFWIWTSLWIFSVLYRENDGNLRMYTIFAMILGMLVYHRTISEPFVKISGKIFRKIIFFVCWPIKRLKIYISFLGKKLKKRIESLIIK